MTDNLGRPGVASGFSRKSSDTYSPTAFNCRRRSQTPVSVFRNSSSVMFRYRCVVLMSECPSTSWMMRMSTPSPSNRQAPSCRPPLQDRREPSLRVERDAPVLRSLGVGTGDHDLMLRPLDVAVLDAQHLALPAARLEGADDAIVHRRPRAFVLG